MASRRLGVFRTTAIATVRGSVTGVYNQEAIRKEETGATIEDIKKQD